MFQQYYWICSRKSKTIGNTHLFFPIVSKKDYTRLEFKSLLEDYFQGSFPKLATFFARENNLSISELEDMLKQTEAELLTIAFWFNPFVWWFGRSIRQNHEYLADDGVLAQGRSPGRYQALIITQLMGMRVVGVANLLNFSVNATRFKMMTKKKGQKIRA